MTEPAYILAQDGDLVELLLFVVLIAMAGLGSLAKKISEKKQREEYRRRQSMHGERDSQESRSQGGETASPPPRQKPFEVQSGRQRMSAAQRAAEASQRRRQTVQERRQDRQDAIQQRREEMQNIRERARQAYQQKQQQAQEARDQAKAQAEKAKRAAQQKRQQVQQAQDAQRRKLEAARRRARQAQQQAQSGASSWHQRAAKSAPSPDETARVQLPALDLTDAQQLRRAILMHEILSPPVALRRETPAWEA